MFNFVAQQQTAVPPLAAATGRKSRQEENSEERDDVSVASIPLFRWFWPNAHSSRNPIMPWIVEEEDEGRVPVRRRYLNG